MKNHRTTISFVFLAVLMLAMSVLVYTSRAQEENLLNPYDSANLSVDDIIKKYHNNMNDAFNNYIKLMMTNLQKNITTTNTKPDPNSLAYHLNDDGTTGAPFTVEECWDAPKNYSTFCVAANLLGANADNCQAPSDLVTLPDDIKKFCSLGGDALPLKGYLNFIAAIRKKKAKIFQTETERNAYADPLKKWFVDSPTAITSYVSSTTMVDQEMKFAKQTLDQTLSAYDQLGIAWPIHLKYVNVYSELETYRDKLVDLRHQTDVFPKKFVDMTTTACT